MAIKKIIVNTLNIVAGQLAGKGLKLRPLRAIYNYLTRELTPESDRVIEANGYKLQVITDRHGLDGTTGTLVATKKYEPLTTQIFEKLLKPNMKVIDVGANIGYYTLLSSKLVGEAGKVWAIEPEPNNIKLLKENIALNGYKNIEVIEKAASNYNGMAQLYVSHSESGEHSLISSRPHIKDNISVEVSTLDNITDENVDLIKSDTEGNEIAVLQGASRLLQGDVKLIIEIWNKGIIASGKKPKELLDLLELYSFDYLYMIDEVNETKYFNIIKEEKTAIFEESINRSFDISVNLLCSKRKVEII